VEKLNFKKRIKYKNKIKIIMILIVFDEKLFKKNIQVDRGIIINDNGFKFNNQHSKITV